MSAMKKKIGEVQCLQIFVKGYKGEGSNINSACLKIGEVQCQQIFFKGYKGEGSNINRGQCLSKNSNANFRVGTKNKGRSGLIKPGEVEDFFVLVSMKSPNFCQKAKF